MTDPERLFVGTGPKDELELGRALLGSIRDVSPPSHAKEAAWSAIAAKVGAASVAATAAAASTSVAPKAAAAGLAVSTGKLLAGAAIAAGSALLVGSVWLGRAEPPHSPEANSLAAPAIPAAAAVTAFAGAAAAPGGTAPSALAEPKGALQTPASIPPNRPRRDDALGLESELLTEARSELRSGDARAALATLAQLDSRVPHGVLGQEREVLAIQALSARGNDAQARRRARAFVALYPNSPHTAALRVIAGDP